MKGVTACTRDCPDACSLVVVEKKDGSLSVRGNPDHPFTKGFCCPKGTWFIDRFINHPDRITRPLLKDGDGFRPVSWSEALDLCAEKTGALRETPETILHVHGHGSRGVMCEAASLLFRELGTSAVSGSICDDTGIEACRRDYGSLKHNSIEDILNATRMVNWGKDFERYSIHLAALVKKARDQGTRVLTVSPGGDSTRAYSDEWIRIRPGTDRFLAAAVIKMLIDREPIDPAILDRTANWPAFKALLAGCETRDLLAAADVSSDDADRLFRYYDRTEPVASIIGWGLQRYLYGGENIRFINALALMTGHVGRKGGGTYYNVSSSRNLGPCADSRGEYSRRFLQQDIGREIIEADPRVEMAWIDCFNLVNQVPDSRAVVRALNTIDFVVVVEAFMNDTACQADLILPPALMMEREQILGSCLHNHVNYSGKVLDPPGEAKSDFEIMTLLGRRLDPPIHLPSTEECMARALKSPSLNVSYEALREKGYATADHPDLVYENLIFDHPDGKFHFVETLNDEPPVEPDYPLHLLSLIDRKYIHSQIPEEDQNQTPTAWISPQNPMIHSLDLERPVFLVTRLGKMRVTPAWERDLHPDAVVIRRGGWMKYGRGANMIITPMVTDMGQGTAQYSQRVRLEN